MSDYDVNPLDRVEPIDVKMSIQFQYLILNYQTNIKLEPNSQFLIYVNGLIYDRNGYSGKKYLIPLNILVNYKYFAVTVIKNGLSNIYDPFNGVEYNMFSLIFKDIVLSSDRYVCGSPQIFNSNDLNKPNFIPSSYNQKGITICNNDIVDINERIRLIGDKLVNKPAIKKQLVLKVNDYRYFTEWDIQAFRTGKIRQVPCSPYRKLSYKTCSKATIGSNKFPISDLTVNRNN